MRHSEQSTFAHNVWSKLIARFFSSFARQESFDRGSVLTKNSLDGHLFPNWLLNIHLNTRQRKKSKDAMQRSFRVLTLSITGWDRKNWEPKSRKLPASENFCNTKERIIVISELYEKRTFSEKGNVRDQMIEGKGAFEKKCSFYRMTCNEEMCIGTD